MVLNLVVVPRERESLDLTVLVVDTRFTSTSQKSPAGRSMKARSMEEALRITLQSESAPDIILLPADSRFTTIFNNSESALAHLNQIAPESKTLMVDSARIATGEGGVALRAFYYDLSADASDVQHHERGPDVRHRSRKLSDHGYII